MRLKPQTSAKGFRANRLPLVTTKDSRSQAALMNSSLVVPPHIRRLGGRCLSQMVSFPSVRYGWLARQQLCNQGYAGYVSSGVDPT